jgi:hypothetical protein
MQKRFAPSPVASAAICCVASVALAIAYQAARAADRIATAHHQDESLEREMKDLASATPDAERRLKERTGSLREDLPKVAAFEQHLRGGARHWSAQSRSTEFVGGIEIRHYVLAYDSPAFESWGDIASSLQSLCALPGLSVDRFSLTGSPEADRFTEAQLAITVRLRP